MQWFWTGKNIMCSPGLRSTVQSNNQAHGTASPCHAHAAFGLQILLHVYVII
jgi:hypothetical protein